MIVAIIKTNKIVKTFLPEDKTGDYVLKDNVGNMIGNVVGDGQKWTFHINKGYQLISNDTAQVQTIVTDYMEFAVRSIADDKVAMIYAYPTNVPAVEEYKIKKAKSILGPMKVTIFVILHHLLKANMQ